MSCQLPSKGKTPRTYFCCFFPLQSFYLSFHRSCGRFQISPETHVSYFWMCHLITRVESARGETPTAAVVHSAHTTTTNTNHQPSPHRCLVDNRHLSLKNPFTRKARMALTGWRVCHQVGCPAVCQSGWRRAVAL